MGPGKDGDGVSPAVVDGARGSGVAGGVGIASPQADGRSTRSSRTKRRSARSRDPACTREDAGSAWWPFIVRL